MSINLVKINRWQRMNRLQFNKKFIFYQQVNFVCILYMKFFILDREE